MGLAIYKVKREDFNGVLLAIEKTGGIITKQVPVGTGIAHTKYGSFHYAYSMQSEELVFIDPTPEGAEYLAWLIPKEAEILTDEQPYLHTTGDFSGEGDPLGINAEYTSQSFIPQDTPSTSPFVKPIVQVKPTLTAVQEIDAGGDGFNEGNKSAEGSNN